MGARDADSVEDDSATTGNQFSCKFHIVPYPS